MSSCLLSPFSPVLHGGLYVERHEEVQRSDLCVCIMVEEWTVGSDTVKMTGQSDVSDSHEAAGREGSGGKVLWLHSGCLVWVLYTLFNLSFVTEGDLWTPWLAHHGKQIV